MIKIRRLKTEDIILARELFFLFQTEDGITDPEIVIDSKLKRQLSDKNFWVFAVFKDSFLVGGLSAFLLKMYKPESDKILLYEISVKQKYRRQGIGRKLFRKLINLAQKNNIKKILIPTTNEYHDAINFYKTIGAVLQKDAITFTFAINKS